MNQDTTIVRGTENVFADLGYADAETHRLKAGMVTRIRDLMSEHKLTQIEAAKRMGLSQPDVSRLLRGQFREVSVERLMKMLTRLGFEVDIVVREAGQLPTPNDTIHLHPRQPM
jgi:predicted XRE-type DNA-binding protein